MANEFTNKEEFSLFQLEAMPKLAQLQTLAELVGTGTDVSAYEALDFEYAKKLLINLLTGSNWLRANEILRRHRAKGKRNPDSWNEETIGLLADHTLIYTKKSEKNGLTFAHLTAWNERWGHAGFGFRFPVPEWLHMGDNEMMDSIVLEFHLDRSEY